MAENLLHSPEDPKTDNLVNDFDSDEAKEIGRRIVDEYSIDLRGRADWERKRDRFYKLWLCHREPKNEPWPNASNVCLPILATACNQFHARSYQAFFAPPSFVKTLPVGANDKARAKNVEDFMNWQIQYDMGEQYEEETDKLLLNVPIGGSNFKKIYYDSVNERPVSEYVSGMDIILPYRTRSLETRRRLTHRLWLHLDELEKRAEDKIFLNVGQLKGPASNEAAGQMPTEQTKDKVETMSADERERPRLILERHEEWKTSKDKKREPYIFTVDFDTKLLLRATRRTAKAGSKTVALDYFTHYGFIPNPEGFYTFGLGHFLEQLNEMANTAFNQIFDAGRISNQPFGFYGRRAGIKREKIRLYPGVMTEVEDAQQIYFPNMQRLDQSLFQVLGLINQFVERFTSTSDYILGRENRGTKTPTATGTTAIIEQGLIMFNIMTKRLFRSLRKELRLIFINDQLFLPKTKQYKVQESEEDIAFKKIQRDDFDAVEHVVSIGDPSYGSQIMRRQEAAELYTALLNNPLIGYVNPQMKLVAPRALWEVTKDFIESYGKKYIGRFLPKLPDPPLSPEQENAMMFQGDTVEPKEGENHLEHLTSHTKFETTEYYQQMSEEKKKEFQEHKQKTQALMYLEMSARQNFASPGSPISPAASSPAAAPPPATEVPPPMAGGPEEPPPPEEVPPAEEPPL